MSAAFFASQAEFREWLSENDETEKELVVGYYKVATGKPSMTWSESVDQALCFGWIDGIRRRIDEESYSIRFTPRRPTSNWSDVNLKKMVVLKKKGLLQQAGLDIFAKRKKKTTKRGSGGSAKFSAELKKRFVSDSKAWKFFETQPAYYKKMMTEWVMSAKQEPTRLRRLEKPVEASQKETRVQ